MQVYRDLSISPALPFLAMQPKQVTSYALVSLQVKLGLVEPTEKGHYENSVRIKITKSGRDRARI